MSIGPISIDMKPPPIDKCRETALELVSSEKSYVRGLKTIIRSFCDRLRAFNDMPKRRNILTSDEIDAIFLNIRDLYRIQKAFYEDLKKLRLVGAHHLVLNLHEAILELSPMLEAYNEYARQHYEANVELQRLRKKNAAFQDLITLTEAAEGTTLEGLLIQPVQRVPRYILLLKEMLRHVVDSTVQENLTKALNSVLQAADRMNLTIKHHEIHSELLRLEEMFQMRVLLIKPERYLVKEGFLRKLGNARDSSIFAGTLERKSLFLLFNDMLLCASDNSMGPARLRFAVPLHLLQVIDNESTAPPTSFTLTTPSKELILNADSEQDRSDWVQKIRLNIESFVSNPTLEKRSTEAELEFTLKRNPAKALGMSIMNEFRATETTTPPSPTHAIAATGANYSLSMSIWAPASHKESSDVGSSDPVAFEKDVTEVTPTPAAETMQGYLSKRGDGIKTWKRRYFVADGNFKLLRYFKDEDSSKRANEALGFIDLDGCVTLADVEEKWGPHAFEVYPQTSDRCYMLIADSNEVRDTWITFLRRFSNRDRFMEGWLNKKGAMLTGWKSRYFVCLQSVKEILYFKSQAESAGPGMFARALGSIHLKGCHIRECSERTKASFGKGTAVFEIQSSEEDGDEKVKILLSSSVHNKPSKTYVMAATDEATMRRWILLLNVVVGSSPQDNEQRLPTQTVDALDSMRSP